MPLDPDGLFLDPKFRWFLSGVNRWSWIIAAYIGIGIVLNNSGQLKHVRRLMHEKLTWCCFSILAAMTAASSNNWSGVARHVS